MFSVLREGSVHRIVDGEMGEILPKVYTNREAAVKEARRRNAKDLKCQLDALKERVMDYIQNRISKDMGSTNQDSYKSLAHDIGKIFPMEDWDA